MTDFSSSQQKEICELKTHIARLNEELKQNEIKQMKFLSNISHQFRTPLNTIIGYCEALKSGLPEPLSSSQLEMVHKILESGEEILDLINAFLLISEISIKRKKIESTLIDFPKLMQKVINNLLESGNNLHLQIKINKISDIPPIKSDLLIIEPILRNWLKFMLLLTNYTINFDLEINFTNNILQIQLNPPICVQIPEPDHFFEPFIFFETPYKRKPINSGFFAFFVNQLCSFLKYRLEFQIEKADLFRFILTIPNANEDISIENGE